MSYLLRSVLSQNAINTQAKAHGDLASIVSRMLCQVAMEKIKISCVCQESNHDFNQQACSLVTIQTFLIAV